MPILDPKEIQAAIDMRIAQRRQSEESSREFKRPSARKKRAEDIEKLLTENITPDVLRLIGTRTLTYKYVLDWGGDTSIKATLTVSKDGLSYTGVRGNWWNGLASPRQVAAKMVENGVVPAEVEKWLKAELPQLL